MLYVLVAVSVALVVAVGVLVRPVVSKPSLVVHTVEGQSISGVSVSRSPLGVTLRSARHLDADVGLDGDVFIPRRQVHFVQRVTS